VKKFLNIKNKSLRMKLETKHFIIIHSLDARIVSDFSKSAEKKYEDVYSNLNFLKKPKKKIKIVLCKTFKEFSFVKKYLSSWRWSQGWGGDKQISLNLKRIAEKGEFETDSYDFVASSYVTSIIGHELVHAFLGRTLCETKDFPVWLNEGLAEYIGENAREIKKVHKLLRFSNVVGRRHLCYEEEYDQATNMVIFLANKYGKKKLFEFLKNCQKLKSFKRAFNKIYDTDFRNFEDCFLKSSR